MQVPNKRNTVFFLNLVSIFVLWTIDVREKQWGDKQNMQHRLHKTKTNKTKTQHTMC